MTIDVVSKKEPRLARRAPHCDFVVLIPKEPTVGQKVNAVRRLDCPPDVGEIPVPSLRHFFEQRYIDSSALVLLRIVKISEVPCRAHPDTVGTIVVSKTSNK